MDSVGEGEGGKIWENGIETCAMSCMKRDASPGSMHDPGCLRLVHWDDPEGWYGEGGGRRVQDGEHMRNKKFKKKLHIYFSTIIYIINEKQQDLNIVNNFIFKNEAYFLAHGVKNMY